VQVSHGSEIKPRRGHPEPAQMLVEHEQRSQNNSSERSCPTADNPPPVSSKIDTNAPPAAAHAHPSARAVFTPKHIPERPMRAIPRFVRFPHRPTAHANDHGLPKLECDPRDRRSPQIGHVVV
jgi:hypothetical protein